jgi:hypothetical protein
MTTSSSARSAAIVAAIAVLGAVAWLALNVAFNYGGNLTGLFYIGAGAALPPQMEPHTRRVEDRIGYDGQFYHLMAHDPLIRRGFLSFVDNPRTRWRRIGVPGLAAVLAAGSDRWVDWAYIGIQLVFVFLGVFCLSRYAQEQRWHPAWGLAFLAIPAVAVSLDRMTIDLPLAALCIGLVLYAERPAVYAILCAAPLIRETGMLLVIAWCLHAVVRQNWRGALLGGASALPAIGWWVYVHAHTPVDGTPWLGMYPFSGLIERTLQGLDAGSTLWLRAASVFEELALLGMWLALALAFHLAWKRRWGLIELTAITFAVFAATLGKLDLWSSAYATGRTQSPLLIMLALLALRDRRWVPALPLLLVVPRIALQYEAQLKQMLRGLS